MSKRIGVTGVSAITSLGSDIDLFTERLKAGYNGIRTAGVTIGGSEVDVLCAEVGEYPRGMRDRVYKMAEDAALQAAPWFGREPERGVKVGLFIATATGSIPFYERHFIPDPEASRLYSDEGTESPRYSIIRGIGEYMTESYKGCFAKTMTVTSACASGNIAISVASQYIRAGILEEALLIGVDVLSVYDILGFRSLGILSSGACRPFDASRDGIALGEGAAALYLKGINARSAGEEEAYAYVAGTSISNEANQFVTPDPEGKGAIRAMNMALRDARLSPEQIHYINAHGTGTALNDSMETLAIHRVFGDKAYDIPVSSSKSMLGHTRGASGIVEAVVCVQALRHQFAPPTINYRQADEACYLDYVPNRGRDCKLVHVMSNSFGFGGHCSSVILSRGGH